MRTGDRDWLNREVERMRRQLDRRISEVLRNIMFENIDDDKPKDVDDFVKTLEIK